jgi:hypothetical protein
MNFEEEYIEEVYPYAAKCHQLYQLSFSEIFCGNNATITRVKCQFCVEFNTVHSESIIYRCRLCYAISCELCGNRYPKEPFEVTERINKSRCGRYTLVETTAKTHLGSSYNGENAEDFKCDECYRLIGSLKNGDYTIVNCSLCLKVFCQFCKYKHMDKNERKRLLAYEFILKNTCSSLNFLKTYGKERFAGFEGTVDCSKCRKDLGTLGMENNDFTVYMCRACRDPYCYLCMSSHNKESIHSFYMKSKLKVAEEEDAKIKNITGPKCGSEFVYLTSEGKEHYMSCDNCNSRFYVKGLGDDDENTLLNRCMKCKKFLCLKCKDHYNQEELDREREREIVEESYLHKFCSNKSSILSSYKTLFPKTERIEVLDCDNCKQPLLEDCDENYFKTNKDSEDNLPEDDYKIFNCRACNQKLCEACSVDHSSSEFQNYKELSYNNMIKKTTEMMKKRKFMRYKVPCNATIQKIEAFELWPKSVNDKFDNNCDLCKVYINSYKPFYSCILEYCQPCKLVLCTNCVYKHQNAIRYSCNPEMIKLENVRKYFKLYGERPFYVVCSHCKIFTTVPANEDKQILHCGNCERFVCEGCRFKHNGNYFDTFENYEASYLIDGPDSLTKQQYEYIDNSVLCMECGECAIDRYGVSWFCENRNKRFCDKCRMKLLTRAIPESEVEFKHIFKKLNDPFNCGKDTVRIPAKKAREHNAFFCSYFRCQQKIDVSPDTMISYCERCRKSFCDICGFNHCSPSSLEYHKYLQAHGQDVESTLADIKVKSYEIAKKREEKMFEKKQREEHLFREEMQRREQETLRKMEEEITKMLDQFKETQLKTSEEENINKHLKLQELKKNGNDAEYQKLLQEQGVNKNEEAELKIAEEKKRLQEEFEKKKKQDEEKLKEEELKRKSCGPQSCIFFPSTVKQYGPTDKNGPWSQGSSFYQCSVCSYKLGSFKEDRPCVACRNCCKIFCITHGEIHKKGK